MATHADPDPLLTGPQSAQRAGLAPATWRNYVHRGYAPPPDDPDGSQPPSRRNPRWHASTVDRFKASRLGRGRRTDLAQKDAQAKSPPDRNAKG